MNDVSSKKTENSSAGNSLQTAELTKESVTLEANQKDQTSLLEEENNKLKELIKQLEEEIKSGKVNSELKLPEEPSLPAQNKDVSALKEPLAEDSAVSKGGFNSKPDVMEPSKAGNVEKTAPEENPKLIEENPKLIEENPKMVKENPGMVEANPVMIEENPGIVEANLKMIKENRVMIEANPVMIEANPGMIKENRETIGENAVCTEVYANSSGNKVNQQADVVRQEANAASGGNSKAMSRNSEGKKVTAFPKSRTDREKSAQKQIEGLREFSAFLKRIPRDQRGKKENVKILTELARKYPMLDLPRSRKDKINLSETELRIESLAGELKVLIKSKLGKKYSSDSFPVAAVKLMLHLNEVQFISRHDLIIKTAIARATLDKIIKVLVNLGLIESLFNGKYHRYIITGEGKKFLVR